MAYPYKIKSSSGKGEGVFATEKLEIGARVMRDKETMRTGLKPNEYDTQKAFDQLDDKDKQRFMKLDEGARSYKTKVHRIYRTNAFASGDGSYCFVYLDVSKINHSCTPNAELVPDPVTKAVHVVAVRGIDAGEEVSISYSPVCNFMKQSHRQRWLKFGYGFACDCQACSQDGWSLWKSDARRQMINVIYHVTNGSTPMDFSVVDEWATEEGVAEIGDSIFRSYDLKVKLSLEMVTANSFLLAGLLEAEGLIGTDLVKAYQRAASSLMLQVEGREDCLILLGSIELVRTWMEKAKDLGFLLSDPQSMMRRNLQQEQDSIVVTLEMWVAKNYLKAQSDKSLPHRKVEHVEGFPTEGNATFALHFMWYEGQPAVIGIDKQKCEELARDMRLRPQLREEAQEVKRTYARGVRREISWS